MRSVVNLSCFGFIELLKDKKQQADFSNICDFTLSHRLNDTERQTSTDRQVAFKIKRNVDLRRLPEGLACQSTCLSPKLTDY